MDRSAFAVEIRRFLNGDVTAYEFDDAICASFKDHLLEEYRQEIIALPDIYPPSIVGSYASEEGLRRLLEIADEIENSDKLR